MCATYSIHGKVFVLGAYCLSEINSPQKEKVYSPSPCDHRDHLHEGRHFQVRFCSEGYPLSSYSPRISSKNLTDVLANVALKSIVISPRDPCFCASLSLPLNPFFFHQTPCRFVRTLLTTVLYSIF